MCLWHILFLSCFACIIKNFGGSAIKMSLGQALKQLRKGQSLTLAELARRTHSHVGNLSRIERGAAKPSLDLLYRLADALNLSLTDIFSVAEHSEADEDQIALNALYIALLEEDRALLVEFAKLLKKRSSRPLDSIYVNEQSVPSACNSASASPPDFEGVTEKAIKDR